jgi:hypothetical protein
MWKKLGAVVKEGKTYWGAIGGVFGVLNNFLHIFMPLAPSLRLQTTIVLIIATIVVVGITAVLVKGKVAPISSKWVGSVAGIWGGLGFLSWGLYAPILGFLETHAHTRMASQLFDSIQSAAYVCPFLCWSIALTALATVFL